MSTPQDPAVNVTANLLADLAALAGLLGVTVPAFFQNPQIVLQIAGAIVGLVGIGAGFLAKRKMATALNTANAKLAVALKKGN